MQTYLKWDDIPQDQPNR